MLELYQTTKQNNMKNLTLNDFIAGLQIVNRIEPDTEIRVIDGTIIVGEILPKYSEALVHEMWQHGWEADPDAGWYWEEKNMG